MAAGEIRKVLVVDSHTGGEPTRVVLAGGPTLNGDSLAEKREDFRQTQDRFRASIINEPRGSDIIVGALVLAPVNRESTASVIFFNNVGVLNMCGHGTIGLVRTLAYIGSIKPGSHKIDTPVGTVDTILHENGEVTVRNVLSYRWKHDVEVVLDDGTVVMGDIAWGGNWFFLCHVHGLDLHLDNLDALNRVAWQVRRALERDGITGENGGEIDHIELTASAHAPYNDGRNFVLCPGGAYDRSPCGTGTSAKLACLSADGKLKEGDIWRQESITGSVFKGSVDIVDGGVLPSIRGTAYITAEINLVYDAADPLEWGIPAPSGVSCVQQECVER